nr:cAMP dependent protein kinase type II regulatory [Hymenolepis microstoma]
MEKNKSDVPDSLVNILQDFTMAVLRNRPTNIPRFAVEYFTELMASEEGNVDAEQTQTSTSTNSKNISEISEGEIIDDSKTEKLIEEALKRPSQRRNSVSAEPFNPEDEEEINSGEHEKREASFYEKTPKQIERLMEVCRRIVLFSELDDNELTELVNEMFMRSVSPHEDIIQQNDDGDYFYAIDSGKYEAKIADTESGVQKVVMVYDNEGFFGELALMYNSPRSATVTALTEGILWGLSRHSFRKHVLTHAAKRRRSFVELLHSVPILHDLTPYQRTSLADNLQRKAVKQGELIIREGDPGDALYFIMDGFVVVRKKVDQEEIVVNKIGKGGYFGELALLVEKPRAASVYADTDVELARLGVKSFERLLGPCINLMKNKALEYKTFKDAI